MGLVGLAARDLEESKMAAVTATSRPNGYWTTDAYSGLPM